MLLSSRRLGLVLSLAACMPLGACGGSDSGGGGGSGNVGGGTTTTTPDPERVRFDEPGTLTLVPGEAATLGVSAEPAAPHEIGFTLVGSPLDAWLDPANVNADAATGHASVALHAPSGATTFHVRASLLDEMGAPGASADRAVAVSEQGFGDVKIEPAYAGQRPVKLWIAGVAALADCADLAATLPEEPPGALVTSAAAGSPLIVDNAPVGTNLAVIARAGHYAWGCANTTALTPGDTLTVSVTIIDKPLDLTDVSLWATFGYEADVAIVAPLFAHATLLLAEAFVPTGGKVGSVLLNGMAALTSGSNAAAFAAQRIDKGWDALAMTHFAAQSPGLRERLEIWAAAGLALQPAGFEARITSAGAADPPSLTITRFGDVAPASAGVALGSTLTWSAEPGDKVLLGAALTWEPSRFAGAAALTAAQQDIAGAATVAEALAIAADCHGLATTLGAFGSCNVGCVEHLCADALNARFSAALGASAASGKLGTITVKASADATVGDRAEPVALSGHWIGEITDGTFGGQVMGDLAAQAE